MRIYRNLNIILENMSKFQTQQSQSSTQKETNFVDVSRKLLIKLADKRKSSRKETNERKKWAKAEEQRKVKQNQEQKIHKLQQQNKIVYIQEQDEGKESSDCIIISGQDKKQKKNEVSSLKKPQRIKQKIMLFELSLNKLISIFLQELYNPLYKCLCSKTQHSCTCHRGTSVHRAVFNDKQVQSQIDKLRALVEKEEHYFNEDRVIMLHNNQGLEDELFAKDIVTAHDHRGLSMLIKRINHEKYSVKMQPSPSSTIQYPRRNKISQNFFSLQYTNPVPFYYKQLLGIEIKYKRYLGIKTQKCRPVIGIKSTNYGPSNFVRKLMQVVFKQKIKGEGEILYQVMKMEQNIQISIVAESLLKNMRQREPEDEMVDEKAKHHHKKQKYCEQIYNPAASYRSGMISQRQKQAIENALEDIRRNRKVVPYPYCMFLQYRLRAQKQPHYQNPYNPSSGSQDDYQDDELYQLAKSRKIFKDMNVYKGYKGYKTKYWIAQTRKTSKGIIRSTKLLSNPQQFYLKSLEANPNSSLPPTSTKAQKNASVTQEQLQPNPHTQQNNEQNPQAVPYPYCLSIFSAYPKINMHQIIAQQHMGQQHENNSSPEFSQKPEPNLSTQKQRKNYITNAQVIDLID